jgi:hypothetical protein
MFKALQARHLNEIEAFEAEWNELFQENARMAGFRR